MKRRRATSFVLLPVFLVFLSLGACSEESSQNADGVSNRAEVDLGDGSFSFLLPEGFQEFIGKETTNKRSSHKRPGFAFGIEGTTMAIAVVLTDIRVEESDIADYLSGMAEAFSKKLPGYVELTKEVREINGVTWGRLELLSHKGDSELHMDNYITCLSGRSLLVNVSATEVLYAEYKQDLIAAIESFELHGRC